MKTKILLLVGFLISPIAFADECKLKTLKGTYIYNSSMYGVQAGMVVYDGKGNFKIKYQPSNKADLQSFSGTYSIDSNCIGTQKTSEGTIVRLFVSPEGKEYSWVVINKKESGYTKRVSKKKLF
jgi:hypothetical protein